MRVEVYLTLVAGMKFTFLVVYVKEAIYCSGVRMMLMMMYFELVDFFVD